MKPGDPIITWSQNAQCLRLGTFMFDKDDSEEFVYSDDSTTYTRRWESEGALWIRGEDLESPEAHALLVAFHLTYRK